MVATLAPLAPRVPEAISLTALLTFGGTVLLLTVGAAICGLYLLTCRIWPFRNCRRCKGLGRLHAPNRKAWRDCPKCEGTGRRLRIGRRLWNHAERAKRNAI
ncbi:hypothetical protein OHB24_14695 [Kribbella sp. NBC_00482]|uniref:hypothetical protein n=1 Tax=Kribbella sp. NBC_00482 TaxID=2975968 RepID=UPI002E19C964